jgi:hypothetical protein
MHPKKIFVMNSSMMPVPGIYICKEISAREFAVFLTSAEEIVSSVAYPEIQDVVGQHLGINIPIDHEKGLTTLDPYSFIIVVKLKYRVPSQRKGHRLGSKFEDYQFFKIKKHEL